MCCNNGVYYCELMQLLLERCLVYLKTLRITQFTWSVTRNHQLIRECFFFEKILKQVVNLVQDPAFSLLWLRKITESWVRVAGTLAPILIGYLSSLPQRVRGFLHPSRQNLGPTQPPVQCIPGLFPEDTATEAWD